MLSAAAGLGFAGLLQVAALLSTQAGYPVLGRVVDWPTTILHALTKNDGVAIFAGFPLGGLAYSLVAFLIFRNRLADG